MAGLMGVACVQDAVPTPPAYQEGAQVQLRLRTPEFTLVPTKAELNENAIQDLYVLQFVDGSLKHKLFYTSEQTAFGAPLNLPFQDIEQMNVEGKPAGKLYVLANFRANNLDAGDWLRVTEGETPGLSLADFEAKTLQYTLDGVGAGPSGTRYVPMYASATPAIGSGVTVIYPYLSRLVAKLNLSLSTHEFKTTTVRNGTLVYEQPAVTVKKIELHNIPRTLTLEAQQGPDTFLEAGELYAGSFEAPTTSAEGPYLLPEGNAASFRWYSLPEGAALSDFYTSYTGLWQEGDPLQLTAYVPEHAFDGSYSAFASSVDAKKAPSTFMAGFADGFHTGAADVDRTFFPHLFVEVAYTLSGGRACTARYNIYLGGADLADMSLLRNHAYSISVSLQGADSADVRIDAIVPAKTGMELQPNANCYLIHPEALKQYGEGKLRFILPIKQELDGWEYLRTNRVITQAELVPARTNFQTSNPQWSIVTSWRTWGGGSDNNIKYKHLTTNEIDWVSNHVQDLLGYVVDQNSKYRFVELIFPDCMMDPGFFAHGGHNAQIVLKASGASGTLYWAWHLWFTDYIPGPTQALSRSGSIMAYDGAAFAAGGQYEGMYMMDRNLGATSMGLAHGAAVSRPGTASQAAAWTGLLYQHGRKDPFVGPSAAWTPETAGTSGARTALYNSSGASITLSSITPEDYMASLKAPGQWLASGTTWPEAGLQTVDLWAAEAGTAKSPFDPCPYGWRVPRGSATVAHNAWDGLTTENGLTPYEAGNPLLWGAWYGLGGSMGAWFPYATNLGPDNSYNPEGTIVRYLWTATGSSTTPTNATYFGKNNVANASRLQFLPVRCVQDPQVTPVL